MIKNEVIFCAEKEMINNINVMQHDKETLNIFIDGNKTPTMTETIEIIYKNLNIEREIYDEFMYPQAIDFLRDIFSLTPMKEIEKINLIISNYERHHQLWRYENHWYDIKKTIDFYIDTVKYFENAVIGVNSEGSRKSFDVYLCESDFDIEEMKSRVTSPCIYGEDSPKAGGMFKNSANKLPIVDNHGNPLAYSKFDVYKVCPRDANRFVACSDGNVYFTDDHYETFSLIVED